MPVDRTIGHLAQHLASKTASLTQAPNHQDPSQRHTPHPPQILAPETYTQSNGYGSYAAGTDSASNHSHASNSYAPPNSSVSTRASASYPDPQYAYQAPYTSNTSAYLQSSYAPNDALPATAAAANAYLHNYPSQPPQLNPQYTPTTNAATYSTFHSPGSPTSWRNWAGNMASNLEPGAEYMNSASALMQLGGRSEGPVPQEIAVDGSAGQMWPFMIFDSGTNGAQ